MKLAVIADIHGNLPALEAALCGAGLRFDTVTVPAGEGSKDIHRFPALLEEVLALGIDRKTLIVALASTLCIAVVFANLFEGRFRKPVEKLAMAVLDWLGRRVRGLGALRTTPEAKPAE